MLGNGEVKVASQLDLEIGDAESMENGKMLNADGYAHAVKIAVEENSDHGDVNDSSKGGVNHCDLGKFTNESLSRESVHYDNGSQVVAVEAQIAENKDSKEVTDPESFAKDVSPVKVAALNVPLAVELESNLVALDKVMNHESDSVPVQKSVGSSELKSKKYKEKVHPSETFSFSKADNPSISDANSGKSPKESFTKLTPESNILIGSKEWRAESSDIQQYPEKEV